MAQWYRICLPKQETQVWSLGWEDPLEKEMATHSSNLAWETPWTEEPGLQSTGSQRVRHGWMTKHQQLPHLPELFRGLAVGLGGGRSIWVDYLYFYLLNWLYVRHLLRVPITPWVNRLLNTFYLQHCYANEFPLLSLFYRWKNWASEMFNNFVS